MGLCNDIYDSGKISSSAWTDALSDFVAGKTMAPLGTHSGKLVTPKTSLSISAVYSCIRLLSWTIAMLPTIVFERITDKERKRATDYYLYPILKKNPNPEQTPFEYKALTSVHQNLYGAGISEIEFDNRTGQPIALWPLPPWCVNPFKTSKNSIAYKVYLPGGKIQILDAFQTLVFPALHNVPGKWLSPISLHRETLGLALAQKEFGALTFGQGTNPSGVIRFENNLPKELAEESDRKHFSDNYAGLSKSHRLMFLWNGADYKRIGMKPEDAQYIASQNFGITEIARIYNVPLHLLQHLEKSTSFGKGLEEMTIAFVVFSLMPYLIQWAQQYDKRLVFHDKYFTEFLVDALLKGKLLERYAAYNIGRNGGWLSANDIRSKENEPPLPDEPSTNQGDIYLMPKNMGSLDNNVDKNKPKGDDENEDE